MAAAAAAVALLDEVKAGCGVEVWEGALPAVPDLGDAAIGRCCCVDISGVMTLDDRARCCEGLLGRGLGPDGEKGCKTGLIDTLVAAAGAGDLVSSQGVRPDDLAV